MAEVATKYNTVICAIAKNENLYINNWCKWYIALGVDHIFLYDNNDKTTPYVLDAIDEEYKPYVTIIDIRGKHEQSMQTKCYTEFYTKHKNEFKWCAFFDIDEFLVLKSWKSISAFTNDKRFADTESIRIKWHLYGDDDLVIRDTRIPVWKAFKHEVKTCKLANQGKQIMRGGLSKVQINSCHYGLVDNRLAKMRLSDGTPSKDRISINTPHTEEAYLNHYMTKTISEFVVQKFNRGDACFANRKIDDGYFWRVNKKTPEKLAFLNQVGKIIPCYYWLGHINAGDVFTNFLFSAFGLSVQPVENTQAKLFATGSIAHKVADKNAVVFGCGLHNADYKFTGDVLKIASVRGKLTAMKLGLTDTLLADTGVLLPYVYAPKKEKKYKYGIVTHWSDYKELSKLATDTLPVINMQMKNTSFAAFKEIIDKISECEFILSSSLHGIIFSHALGIPAIHVEQHMLESKDNFKFKDYYSTIDIPYIKLPINGDSDIAMLIKKASGYTCKPSENIMLTLQNRAVTAFLRTLELLCDDPKLLEIEEPDDLINQEVVNSADMIVSKKTNTAPKKNVSNKAKAPSKNKKDPVCGKADLYLYF